MTPSEPRPKWWVLYGLLALAVAGLVAAHRLGLPATAETIMQGLIVAVFFGLIGLWLSANTGALLRDDEARVGTWSPLPLAVARLDTPVGTADGPLGAPAPLPEPVKPLPSGREREHAPAGPLIAGSVLE